MSVQQTSILAYLTVLRSGVVGRQQRMVLECIQRFGVCSDREISEKTGIEKSSVNARRNELVKLGFVEAAAVCRDEKTGKKVILWKVSKRW